MSRTQDHDETIERDGEEIPIVLEIEWSHDRGEFIEAGHPYNGYGAGWYAEVSARNPKTNEAIELTDAEIERFKEKYPHDHGWDDGCDDDRD